MTDDQRRRRIRIPSHLLHGRVRTSTLALCTLWLVMWGAYLTLGQDDSNAGSPAGAVMISETPYVPYVPPVQTTEQSYPTTTTEITPTETPTETPSVTTTPRDTPAPTTGTEQPTVTTTDSNPFRLPQIPGLPGFDGESGSEQTGEPGQ
ncbi:hypothetical protein [Rhodococcus artemisiae]|uniref:Uncharacterized protein n=1 Tax=Rhodococcus artemisiae TaxID=714159 RepID=A0ABU7L7T7_9NOCA|nr:hypothetical protein [Rhodococcus artemisiae]MEE2057604.1 hypothetical protein [Rhodococcus artemisiae]